MEKIRKERLTDRKRAAVVEAAIDEFSKNGFEQTSMDRIAEAARVSKRTVYNHFPSKDELFRAIIDRLREHALETKVVKYSRKRSLQSQLKKVGRSYATMITHKEFNRVSRIALSRFIKSPDIGSVAIQGLSAITHPISQWLEDAKKDRRMDFKNAEDVADMFAAVIKEFAFWPQMLCDAAPLDDAELDKVTSNAAAMILSQYGTEP